MFKKLILTAPRLLNNSSKLKHLSAVSRSNVSTKPIESDYQPSGNIPNDESYNQIPVKINGTDYVVDYEAISQQYPFVPTLDQISIEKTQAVELDANEEKKEVDPELEPKTLEDKLKVWFGENMPTKFDDNSPDRDLVNYPRIPPTLENQPPTRLYFLPESWFKFFESKTGRSGGYVFGATFGTLLISKELICFNDNSLTGCALLLIAVTGMKKFGKQANEYLTSHLIKERQGWTDWQFGMKKLLNDHIKELKKIEERSVNPGLIYDAKRENLSLQQEAEYRRRLVQIYNEVKRKLDYQVAIEETKKSFARKHIINWVLENVNKNVNADLGKAVLKQCLIDLKTLSQKRKNAI